MATTTDRIHGSLVSVRKRLLAILSLGVALFWPTLGCQKPSPLEARQEEPSKSPDTRLPGVPNFSKVCDGLYRGGQPTEIGYETLGGMGVRTIVTLRILDRHSNELAKTGFRTYHISFKHAHPETEDALEFLSIVTNPENQPVFVHCREGVDRTGMMIAVYRIVIQNWSRTEAIDEMKRMGFNNWNEPIERYLLKMDVKKMKRDLADHVKQSRDREKI